MLQKYVLKLRVDTMFRLSKKHWQVKDRTIQGHQKVFQSIYLKLWIMPRLYRHIQTKQKLIHLQNWNVSKQIHHQRIHIYKWVLALYLTSFLINKLKRKSNGLSLNCVLGWLGLKLTVLILDNNVFRFLCCRHCISVGYMAFIASTDLEPED